MTTETYWKLLSPGVWVCYYFLHICWTLKKYMTLMYSRLLFSRFVVDFIHTEGLFLVLYILLVKLEIELKGRCFLFSSVPVVIKDEPSHSRYKVMEWRILYLNNTEKQHNTASHETHSLPRGNWGHETHMSLFLAPTISLLKVPDNSAFLPFSIPGGAIWYLAIS